MAELNYIGKSLIREDVFERSTGETKYLCDVQRHGMLYAKLLLSEKPHAKIDIDTTEALKVDGIVRIFTFEDVPKITYNSHKWFNGVDLVEDEYILSDKARFVGDRIGVVVGETIEAVERALKKVKVTYHELPAVVTIEDAKKDETIVQGATNLAFEKELACGNFEEKFKEADFIVEDNGTTPRIHHAAMETHICLSEVDENGNLIVWTPCQVVFQVQMHVAQVLNIPYNKIRVIKAAMGGSFGGKGQSVLEPVCAFVAYTLKKPVKLIMSRKDAILATRTRNATQMNVKTAVTKDGKILGREITVEINAGAYYTNASAVAMSLAKKSFRLYDISNQSCKVASYYTNTLIGGACRGYGSPQLHAVTEINIDNVAKKIGMDPCEFRLKNLMDGTKKDPTGGVDLGNAQIKQCVELGMKEFDWKNRRNSVKNKETHRYAYGVGMSCGVHGNGYKGAYPDFTNIYITINPDGSAFIKTGLHEQGCGTLTTMQQVAAESLEMPMEKIVLTEADTFISPYDSAGTQASRVTFVFGGAIKCAGEKMKEKIIESICLIKKLSKEDVKIDNAVVHVISTGEKFTYGEIAIMVERDLKESLHISVKYESPANPATYAASFAEVKVDKFTGQVEITDILVINDVGQCVNPDLVRGQIQGGAHMSLGMALHEDIPIDEKGYVKANNFSKYHVINAPEMPEIKVLMIEANEPTGPFGAKSVGEMAAVTPGPAVISAINNALDVNIITYPATPEVIVEAIQNKLNK